MRKCVKGAKYTAGTVHNDNEVFSFAAGTVHNDNYEFSFALCTTINTLSFACERKLVIIVVHNARCSPLEQNRVKDHVAMQDLNETIMAVIHQGDASL